MSTRKKYANSRRKHNRRGKKSLKKYILDTVNTKAEKKVYDRTGSASISSGGIIPIQINPLLQGDLVSNRIGNRVEANTVQLNYSLDSADTFNRIRVMVVQWYMDSGQEPLANDLEDILEDNTYPWVSMYQRKSGSQKYKVHYDKIHTINAREEGSSFVSRATKTFKVFINKGFKKEIQYDGGASTGTNMFYLLAISDSVALSHPSMEYYTRFTYTDM